jgi:hypothetical protein
MMNKHHLIIVIAVIASLVMLGTGIALLDRQQNRQASADATPITDVNIDRDVRQACELADQNALLRALGPGYTKISSTDGAVDMSIFKESNCVFGNGTAAVTISFLVFDNENAARLELVSRRTNQNSFPKEPATMHGEEAFYQFNDAASAMLQYRNTKHIVSIDASGYDSSQTARQNIDAVVGHLQNRN